MQVLHGDDPRSAEQAHSAHDHRGTGSSNDMLTHIRIDQKMEKAIQEIMTNELYKSKSEFIRTAVREKIDEIAKIRDYLTIKLADIST